MAYVLEDLKSLLGRITAEPGVSLAVVVDRQGCLIESAGDMVLEAEMAGALAASLALASQSIGAQLNQGALTSLTVECDAGLILVNVAGPAAMLATVASDPAVYGKVRYAVRRALPDLVAAL
jgi:predicted regulator of Ras-like GTPase activity (Roadblock/LC7/MglB family)